MRWILSPSMTREFDLACEVAADALNVAMVIVSLGSLPAAY
jgi:hypothetical protein